MHSRTSPCATQLASKILFLRRQGVVCRRHIQLQSAGMLGARQAFQNIIQRDGVPGLYKGFLPNALKNLPNKGMKQLFAAVKVNVCVFWAAPGQYLFKAVTLFVWLMSCRKSLSETSLSYQQKVFLWTCLHSQHSSLQFKLLPVLQKMPSRLLH